MTSGLLSQVTIKTLNQGQERHIWFVFESDHDNLLDLNDCLVEEGTIYGTRIETEQIAPGKRREVRRYEAVLGRDALISITPLQFELVQDAAEVVRV